MESNMMNMCNMCMHKAYCPMASGMKPMGMNQIPIDMNMGTEMEMDMDMGMDMGLDMNLDMDMDMEQLQNIDLSDDIMENMRNDHPMTEDIKDIADDVHLTRRRKNSCKCDIDRVLRKMERNNPGIFRRLTMCGMPYFQAKRFVGRIISLSLDYCKD